RYQVLVLQPLLIWNKCLLLSEKLNKHCDLCDRNYQPTPTDAHSSQYCQGLISLGYSPHPTKRAYQFVLWWHPNWAVPHHACIDLGKSTVYCLAIRWLAQE